MSERNSAKLIEANPGRILIVGANGQLGRALQEEFPDAESAGRDTFDISNPLSWSDRDWSQYSTIINAAAYTNVDGAETPSGRQEAWSTNATAVKELARLSLSHLTLVHVSSDYVFDGTTEVHDEEEPFSPLNTYGQTKAAGDLAASIVPKHYIARTSWVVGQGKNFISTIASLAERGIAPTVVDDQIGRLTFTEDLAKAIKHLLGAQAPYGTYNVTNTGESASWADIAKQTYALTGHDPESVTGVSTEAYYAGKDGIAPRPRHSTLDLTKLEATDFEPRDWNEVLRDYLTGPGRVS